MKTIRIGIIGAVALLTVSCSSLTPDQVALIEQARSVKRFPVSRQVLVDTFGLADLESNRTGGGVRGGNMGFSERWDHPSGLSLTGYDSEYVGYRAVTREDIDKILNSPDLSGVPGYEHVFRPRQSFNSIAITSRKGKLIYRSTVRTNVAEQVAASDR